MAPLTGVAARLGRASGNFLETFAFFAAAVLMLIFLHKGNEHSALGAQLYLWARVAYLPIYAAGIPFLRSLVWALALAIEQEVRKEDQAEAPASPSGRTVHWLRESVRLTALVSLATMPLVACYFNQVSWMGLFANLLMVPFVGFIFLPLSLLSAVWVIAAHSSTLPGAGLIDSLGQGLQLITGF